MKKTLIAKIAGTTFTSVLIVTTAVSAMVNSNTETLGNANANNNATVAGVDFSASDELTDSVAGSVEASLEESGAVNNNGNTSNSGTNNGGARNGSVTTAGVARQAFDLINNYRVQNGVPALTWSDADARVATVRAKELASNFSHASASGAGSDGENIADMPSNSPSEVVNAWINSSGHRANILRGSFVTAGLAVYEVNGRFYWSNNFSNRPVSTLKEGDAGTTTTIKDDGTRIISDGSNAKVEWGKPKTDNDGWSVGHFEWTSDWKEKKFSDGEVFGYKRNARAVLDTGLCFCNFSVATVDSLDKSTAKSSMGSVADIDAGRKFKVKVESGRADWNTLTLL